MYDDGHVVECVECLLIAKRELRAEVEKWKKEWFEDGKDRDEAINENHKLKLQNGELLASLKEVVADCTWELSYDIVGRAKALIEKHSPEKPNNVATTEGRGCQLHGIEGCRECRENAKGR